MNTTQDPIQKLGDTLTCITSHPILGFPFLFTLAIGALVSIAGGSYGLYQLVVIIGSRL